MKRLGTLGFLICTAMLVAFSAVFLGCGKEPGPKTENGTPGPTIILTPAPPPQPEPNGAPTLAIFYPETLVGDLTRFVVNANAAQDQNELILTVALNGTTVHTETLVRPAFLAYPSVDFTGMPDGAYTVSFTVAYPDGRSARHEKAVQVNAAELRKRGITFIRDSLIKLGFQDGGSGAIRWPDSALPLRLKVRVQFSDAHFARIVDAAAIWEHTKIPMVVERETEAGSCDSSRQPPYETVLYIQPCPLLLYSMDEQADSATLWEGAGKLAVGYISIDPSIPADSHFTGMVAHQIGHTLGVIREHTKKSSITDANGPTVPEFFRLAPDIAAGFRILYSELQPGDLIPQPAP